MSSLDERTLELQNELQKSKKFTKFKSSFKAMLDEDEARGLYESFRDVQLDLNEKQSKGIEITPAEIEKSRQQFEALKDNKTVENFMTYEYQLNQLIQEVSTVIMKPLEEVYEASMKKKDNESY